MQIVAKSFGRFGLLKTNEKPPDGKAQLGFDTQEIRTEESDSDLRDYNQSACVEWYQVAVALNRVLFVIFEIVVIIGTISVQFVGS